MLAFDMKGGCLRRRFCDACGCSCWQQVLWSGISGILPIYSSHYNMTNEELRRAGVSPVQSCFDWSRGQTDLIEDLKQA